jgi:hypothetical protein
MSDNRGWRSGRPSSADVGGEFDFPYYVGIRYGAGNVGEFPVDSFDIVDSVAADYVFEVCPHAPVVADIVRINVSLVFGTERSHILPIPATLTPLCSDSRPVTGRQLQFFLFSFFGQMVNDGFINDLAGSVETPLKIVL